MYLQVAAVLRRGIANGSLAGGAKLPSIQDLAASYEVSVITIRQALAMLEEEELVTRKQGRGTFVNREPTAARGLSLRSDWESLLRHLKGKQPKLVTIEESKAVPVLDRDAGLLEENYLFMRRIHYDGDLPYALIDIFLSHRIFELDPQRFEISMVIPAIAELTGSEISRLRQRISFTTADPETATALGVAVNSAIGHVRRVITDKRERVIYVGQTRYRGDFVSLDFDLEESPL